MVKENESAIFALLFRWSLIIVLSREECCSNLAKVKFACCNYEFSNHYVLITLRFHSIFRKCFPSVAAPGIWFFFSFRFIFSFFLVAFKTWNKFAFDFYWHIRVFIDRFNLHFDFISIWISQLLWLVVLANKAKAFCIYLRRLVFFFCAAINWLLPPHAGCNKSTHICRIYKILLH